MSRKLSIVMLVVAAASCQRTAPAPDASVTTLRMPAGSGAGAQQFAYALERFLTSTNASVRLAVDLDDGSRAAGIESGEFDVAFAQADFVYQTFAQNNSRHKPSQLRGIAVLQPRVMHLVVMRGSNIHDVADLRNRIVSTGPATSDNAFTARRVLAAAQGVNAPRPQLSRYAKDQLLRGDLDALLVFSTVPFDPIASALRQGARLVAVHGPLIDELRRKAPILRPAIIPTGSYPGQSSGIRTVAVNDLFICHSALDEEVVYRLTKYFFEAVRAIGSEPYLKAVDWSQVDATPIPLHPGAARYYRELELLR